jgi:3-oxoacyl-[acyl-carrier protein] reductase
MFTPITGKTVLVTGGTRGIGKGIAGVFARAGANVAVNGRDRETGAAAAAELSSLGGGRVAFAQGDVAVAADCERIAAETAERFGGIDVLCANAGVFPDRKLAEMTEEDIDAIFATNVKGCMLTVKACIPHLERSGRGRVILTSSITGPITGFPGWSHYGATKAAQLGFLRTACIELAPKRITVNAVLPGNVVSEGLDELGPEYLASMEASVPLGRLGRVEEIGAAALFFASEEAGYITGQTIVVDGGQTLPESLAALQAAG